MKEYKSSQYNIVTYTKDGGMLITNNLYNVHLKIESDDVKKAVSILDNPDMFEEDKELLDLFREKKLVVSSDMCEKELVDYYCNNMIYSDDVLHLTLIPTDACNFRCKYCYQSRSKHVMTAELVETIKKFLKKSAKRYKGMFISWYGGEPTLAKKDVIEIMRYAKEVCRENRIPLYGQMTTNGYELTKELFEELISNHVLSYMVTVDGLKDTHNAQRPHFSDTDSYSKIMYNLKSIRDNVKKVIFV